MWLLVARHCPPLGHGGDGGAALRRKFPYTVAFLRGRQWAWVRPSALVSIAPTLPGHSTGALRLPPGALGPAVFVLDLLQAAAAVQTTTFLKTEAKGPLVLKV